MIFSPGMYSTSITLKKVSVTGGDYLIPSFAAFLMFRF
uniref:Uncharacterized protein n=1 Tax=Nelumbo nucifera TaxID=4432 RepID=A0A822ZL20_NELNU|nr:TPA_asm: hypothetical protein HUJ06_001906 [Nelumbo nucifera]